MLCACVTFELNCDRFVERLVFVCEMADRMEDDAAGVKSLSGEFREREKKSNAIPRERPRRHIRPPQRYIEEEWVPLKTRQITVKEETVQKRSSPGRSGQRSNKSSSSSKLSSHTNSTRRSGSSSKSSETSRQLHLQELKLLQAKREVDARESEERRLAEEDLRRREEERRLSELRRIRELEYEAERLRLQARLEEEEEQRDPESLTNRLNDFKDEEKDDQGLEGANVQSTPYQADTRSPICHTIQTTEHSNVEEKEKLNVSWVQRLCSGEGDFVNKEEVKSVMSRSLPKLGLPRFDGNPLE